MILRRDTLKLLPLFAFQNLNVIQADEVNAEVLKILGVVSMGHQHHSQHILGRYECLDVPRADLLEARDQEVVCVDKKLEEELDTLLADVKMI